MALKFGSLFDDMFNQGFKKISQAINKQISSMGIDSEEIKNAVEYLADVTKEFNELNKEAKNVADEIALTRKELQAYEKGTVEYEAALRRLKELQLEGIDIEEKRKKIQKKQKDAEQDYQKLKKKIFKEDKSNWDKWADTFSKASEKFEQDLEKLVEQFKRGEIDATQFEDKLQDLQFEKLGTQVNDLFNSDIKKVLSKGTDGIKSGIGKWAKTIISKFGPMGVILGGTLVAGVTAALDQVLELNEALIQLQRDTSGMVTAARLGFDTFGNFKTGIQSLNTQLAYANVSFEQFSGAMKDLFSGSLKAGQVAGLADNLEKSQAALRGYGMEAARIEKLYSAKIGPAVGNLVSNFGLGIKDATKFVKDGVNTARALGLSVQAFTENLQQATELAGEFYFKTADQMQKLAGLATQLGTSVNAIAGGVVKMKGITELFNEQQKAASLGLSNFGKNLSKAYALQAQGKGGEAAQVQLAALAKDLRAQGLTNKGAITQQGISTLQATGASQEQIAALQKMTRNAEKAGIALDKAFDPASLTREEKKRLEAIEAQNMTVEESFKTTFAKLKGIVVDPLAKIIAPLVKIFANLTGLLTDVVAPVFNILFDAITTLIYPFQVIAEEVMAIISDVLGPVKDLFSSIQSTFGGLFTVIRDLARFLIKFVMTPFRIIGKVIGGVIEVIKAIWQVIADALAPAFEWLSDLFNSGSEGIDGFLSAIGEAFGWLADFVGGALKTAFKVIGTVIGWVVDGLKALWKGLTYLWGIIDEYIITPISDTLGPVFEFLGDLLSPIIQAFKDLWKAITDFVDWLFGTTEEDTTSEITPDDWKKILGTEDLRASIVEATTPNANEVAKNQQAVFAQGQEQQKANEEAMKTFMTSKDKGNTTINVDVDPLFNNKQILKQ